MSKSGILSNSNHEVDLGGIITASTVTTKRDDLSNNNCDISAGSATHMEQPVVLSRSSSLLEPTSPIYKCDNVKNGDLPLDLASLRAIYDSAQQSSLSGVSSEDGIGGRSPSPGDMPRTQYEDNSDDFGESSAEDIDYVDYSVPESRRTAPRSQLPTHSEELMSDSVTSLRLDSADTVCSTDSFDLGAPADYALLAPNHLLTQSFSQMTNSQVIGSFDEPLSLADEMACFVDLPSAAPSSGGQRHPNTVTFDESTPSSSSCDLAPAATTPTTASTPPAERPAAGPPRANRVNPFLASSTRASIGAAVDNLDTAMPSLDFAKLEETLTTAAREREAQQRKRMSSDVRKDAEYDFGGSCYPPAPTTRPKRSNLATRLQNGMNLQLCYLNDSAPEEDGGSATGSATDSKSTLGDDSSDDDDDSLLSVPKSKSTSDLGNGTNKNTIGRSVSNCSDSTKKASELTKDFLKQQQSEVACLDFKERQVRLETEAKVMLGKAKQAAHMQMEVDKQAKAGNEPPEAAYIRQVVGYPLSGRRRLNRVQLMKMNVTQLQIIVNEMHGKIETLNEELVQLLIERDGLHMEQDSMLVDVEDLVQHHKAEDLKLPEFLIAAPQRPELKFSRFRIFKR